MRKTFFSIKDTPFKLRLFTLLLSIILCFSVVCKPQKVQAAVTGTTLATISGIAFIVATVTGIAFDGARLYLEYKNSKDANASEQDCVDYFKNNISVDGDGNYILTDDAKLTINGMMDSYNESVTYFNAYLRDSQQVLASDFFNQKAYSMFKKLVERFPDKVFVVSRGYRFVVNPAEGKTDGYAVGNGCVLVRAFDVPQSAISDYSDMNVFSATCYDSEWSANVPYSEFFISDVESNSDWAFTYYFKKGSDMQSKESTVYFTDIESLDSFSFDDIPIGNASFDLQFGAHQDTFNNTSFLNNGTFKTGFTSFSGSIPVFKNVVDMKNGISNGTEGRYFPSYTGQPVTNNTVDSHDVTNTQEIINNYYGTGTNPSDPSGDGGGNDDSGSVLTGFLGAIGKIGEAILKILNTLIGIIADAVKVVTGGFTAVTDLVQNGFSDFLASLFPYIPKEWVACITLSLSLLVFGVVIKLFTKQENNMEELLQPFLVVLDWLKTYQITLGGHSFTFFNVFIIVALTNIVIGFLWWLFERQVLYLEEIMLQAPPVSSNTIQKTSEVDSYVGTLEVSIDVPEDKDYSEDLHMIADALQKLCEKSDVISSQLDSISQNSVPVEETVSENTVSENSIITTKIKDYTITESFLMIIVFLLLLSNVLTFLFMKGDK